jgi:4-amino-4-deoxy-L-arabinose transferase-like glycosyltransferase
MLAAVLLAIQLPADPAAGLTRSESPFTDEGWSVLGARNAVLLGEWITDEWQLVIAQLPFNAAAWLVFEAFGVGIVQARIVSVLATCVAVVVLALLVGRRFGALAGLLSGLALATAPLTLYYGRLALLEPAVMAGLVLGFVALVGWQGRGPLPGGILAGIGFAIAVGSKPSAIAPVAGLLVGALLVRGARTTIAPRVAIALATLSAVAIAWLLAMSIAGISVADALRPWPDAGLAVAPNEILERVGRYFVDQDDGAIYANWTLITGTVAGLVAIRHWRARLTTEQRVVIAASVGWLLVGILVLLVVAYRPSRYVVPLLPPMALLTGVGAALLVNGLSLRRPAILAVGLAAAVCAAGVINLVTWTRDATYRLPAIQQEVVDLLPAGAVVQGGFAPTLAMRAPVATVIPQGEVNRGDLYDRLGVRWVLEAPGEPIDWLGTHLPAWEARDTVGCWSWRRGELCLHRVP